jgi:hypothetical protein
MEKDMPQVRASLKNLIAICNEAQKDRGSKKLKEFLNALAKSLREFELWQTRVELLL